MFSNIKEAIGSLAYVLAIMFFGFVITLKTPNTSIGMVIDKFNSIDWASVNWMDNWQSLAAVFVLLSPIIFLKLITKIVNGE